MALQLANQFFCCSFFPYFLSVCSIDTLMPSICFTFRNIYTFNHLPLSISLL